MVNGLHVIMNEYEESVMRNGLRMSHTTLETLGQCNPNAPIEDRCPACIALEQVNFYRKDAKSKE